MDWVREDSLVLLQRGERTTNSSAEGIIREGRVAATHRGERRPFPHEVIVRLVDLWVARGGWQESLQGPHAPHKLPASYGRP